MKTHVYAAIDIGSNAVRLLIKKPIPSSEHTEDLLKKQILVRVPLRLGFDVFTKGEVSAQKALNLVRLMKAYRQLIRIYDVDRLRACATSAMRDAANGDEILKRIKKEADINIEIISGEEEAQIIYNNHLEKGGHDKGAYLFVDVGGGSTELNFINNGRLEASRSYNIGTVRSLTGRVRSSEMSAMHEFLEGLSTRYPEITIIGSGGNINKLYKLAKEKESASSSFPISELARLYHLLEPMDVDQRMERFGLRADRADVIVPAAKIFLSIASLTGARNIIAPSIGVADGIIDGMYIADTAGDEKRKP